MNSHSSYDIPLQDNQKEIRLVTLLSGPWEDVVSCKLSTVSLANPGPYETLSYVWEGEPGFMDIFLNGHPRQITTNLFLALRRLRQRHEERTLWIDALCIDQSDDVEKAHQVALMGKIYRGCVRVYLWMGDYSNGTNHPPDTRTTEDTAELLQRDGKPPSHENLRDRGFAALNVVHEVSGGKHLSELSSVTGEDTTGPRSSVLEAFEELMQKPWWDRIWIVQEVVLPPDATVIYGSFQMPWKSFAKGAHCMSIHLMGCCQALFYKTSIWHALLRFRHEIFRFEAIRHGRPIQDLLYQFRVRKATNDRDMVFGLYGLQVGMLFEPDYTLNKTEIYGKIVRYSIPQGNNLNMLEGQRTPLMTTPTWIYDWSSPLTSVSWYRELLQLQANALYKASLNFSVIIIPDEAERLALSGVPIDKVLLVGTHQDFESGTTFQVVQDFLKECWRLAHEFYDNSELSDEAYTGIGTWKDAVGRTIISDRSYKMSDPETTGHWKRADIVDIHRIMDPKVLDLELGSEEDRTGIRMLFDEIVITTSGRRFFITEKGYMGMGNPEVGDEIWVLLGGRVPFVLRPNKEASTFSMIGDCYLHGIMDGEAMVDVETQTRTVVFT